MIFIQLIKSKNVKTNITTYISIVSLMCSIFGVIEIKLISQSSSQNCKIDREKEKTCNMVKINAIGLDREKQL